MTTKKSITLTIDISTELTSKGLEEVYTPTIKYFNGKETFTTPELEGLNVKWAASGKGKGLKVETKIRAPYVNGDGKLVVGLMVYEIPKDIPSILKVIEFYKKNSAEFAEISDTSTPTTQDTKTKQEANPIEEVVEAVA